MKKNNLMTCVSGDKEIQGFLTNKVTYLSINISLNRLNQGHIDQQPLTLTCSPTDNLEQVAAGKFGIGPKKFLATERQVKSFVLRLCFH